VSPAYREFLPAFVFEHSFAASAQPGLRPLTEIEGFLHKFNQLQQRVALARQMPLEMAQATQENEDETTRK
jgi:hypothetical protein